MSAAVVGLSTARPARAEPIIRIPSVNLGVRVRIAAASAAGLPTVLETTNAAGFGPPLHRRARSEIFEIVTCRFLFEADGQRFIARRGDLVSVPGSEARGFVDVTGTGARKKFVIQQGIDAAAFFNELAQVLASDARGRSARPRAFGKRWRVVYLGALLDARRARWHGGEP